MTGRTYTMKMSSHRVLMLSGLLVWAIAGIRVVGSLLRSGATLKTSTDLIAWLVFLAAFLIHIFFDSKPEKSVAVLALVVQSICAVVLTNSAGGTGMEIALLVMVAGQLPGCLTLGSAIAWVLTQTAIVLGAQLRVGSSFSLAGGSMFFGSYVAFQLFALGAASLAESERVAREALALANAQLERMQSVAVESARKAERLRIARDLHDSLGHRLTALGLTLEAARHLPATEVGAKITEARGLASALMDDLRGSVTDIRDDEAPELRSLLEGLGRSVRMPQVTVEVADSLRITNPQAITALFRISQEIVTNAARHGQATELRLTLRAALNHAELLGVDNGVAGHDYEIGNGLSGIRERAQLLGGDAEFSWTKERGFRVLIQVPLARLV